MDPRLVQRWLESLSGRDLEGLLDLYHPDAILDSGADRLQGRDAIAQRLRRYSRKFTRVRFDLVEGPTTDGLGLTFTTNVSGCAGRWMLRHAWQMEDGRILRHGVEPVEA